MSQEIDFRPSGPVRPNSLYVGWRLHKALGLVARKTSRSREDLAEIVLGTWLAQEHPEIEAWLTQREDEEKAFIKNLTPSVAAKEKEEKQFASETPT